LHDAAGTGERRLENRNWKIENGKWREEKDRVDPVGRREERKEKDNAEGVQRREKQEAGLKASATFKNEEKRREDLNTESAEEEHTVHREE
jgi:hypothetical protein